MKKYSLILLSAFYFICAIGLYVHAHYCGGELASINYTALSDHQDCGCGDEQADDDCCKDITHFYKVDSHQSYHSNKANEIYTFYCVPFISVITLIDSAAFDSGLFICQSHSPPPFLFAKASKIIVNSIFRI